MESIYLDEKILGKLCKYCSYQERSENEVLTKLKALKVQENFMENYLMYLKKEDFLNNKRFATLYCRGKIKQKRWGINLIKNGLYKHKVPSDIIEKVLENYDRQLYIENLDYLVSKKSRLLGEINGDQSKKHKLVQYLLGRGYTAEEIYENTTYE